jgi:sugar phosphate isomerase/epimerase
MAQFGFRAHDFGSFDSSIDLAKTINKIYSPLSIQLALSKVLNKFDSYCDLSINEANIIRSNLEKYNVNTAIVGCYINPIHPNLEERKKQWDQFESALKIAPYLGCPYVGTETGIVNLDDEYDIETFDEKNLDIFYLFLDKMLKVAQKNNSIIAIEPVSNKHTICTISRTTDMLNKFKCDNLKLIYDSVNLMDKSSIKEKDGTVKKIPSYDRQKLFHDSILDEISSEIVAIHIKDFKVDNHGNKIGDLAIGEGIMNYKALFDSLNNHNVNAPRLLEMIDIETLDITFNKLIDLDSSFNTI